MNRDVVTRLLALLDDANTSAETRSNAVELLRLHLETMPPDLLVEVATAVMTGPPTPRAQNR